MENKAMRPAKEARQKIRKKVASIENESSEIQDKVREVLSEILQPVEQAKTLVKEKSKKRFLSEYSIVNQSLEGCLDKLLLLRNAISNFETTGFTESSDNESFENTNCDGSSFPHSILRGLLDGPTTEDTEKQTSNIVNEAEERRITEHELYGINGKNLGSASSAASEYNTERTVGTYNTQKQYFSKGSSGNEQNFHCKVNTNRSCSSIMDDKIDRTKECRTSEVSSDFVSMKEIFSTSDSKEPKTVHENADISSYPLNLSEIDDTLPNVNFNRINDIDVGRENLDSSSKTLKTNRKEKKLLWRSSSISKVNKKLIKASKRRGLLSCTVSSYPVDDQKPIRVIVTKITSPWDIYIQPVNSDFDEMMEDLCMHFAQETSMGYKGGISHIPDIGAFCCAKSPEDKMWYRAKVIKVGTLEASVLKRESDSDSQPTLDDPALACVEVTVLLIDYGTSAVVQLNHLRPLEERFCRTPCQSIHCMLTGVSPKGKEEHVDLERDVNKWSETASEWLIDIVQSECTWTAYLSPYVQSVRLYYLIDLYTPHDNSTLTGDTSRPPIDRNLTYMMLQVGLASFYPTLPSHLQENQDALTDINETNNGETNKKNVNELDIGKIKEKRISKDETSLVEHRLFLPPMAEESFSYRNSFKISSLPNINSEEYFQVVVSAVVNPHLFYVHMVTPKVVEFDDLMNSLQHFYSREAELPSVIHGEVGLGSAVISKYDIDETWCRGVIISERVQNNSQQFEVFHIDYGSKQWTYQRNIRPVASRFFEIPVQIFACRLADTELRITDEVFEEQKTELIHQTEETKRIGKGSKAADVICRAAGDEDTVINPLVFTDSTEKTSVWTQQSIVYFQKLVLQGQPLCIQCKIKQRHTSDERKIFNYESEPIDVYLYDTNGESDVLVNREMVTKGFAIWSVTDPKVAEKHNNTNGESSPTSQSGLMNEWNPMADEFLSVKNSYKVDILHPGLMTVGYQEPQRKICNYFLSRRGCYRGANCLYEHSRPEDPPNTMVPVYCERIDDIINLPEAGKWVIVQVLSFIDPTHFWVRFPLGTRALEVIIEEVSGFTTDIINEADEFLSFQQKLNSFYRKKPFQNKDFTMYAIGEIVAAKYSKDNNWYRAKVIDILQVGDCATFRVFFLDYGNTDVVIEDDTRLLDPQFLHLPFQAVESFLMNSKLKEDIRSDQASLDAANNLFDEYVQNRVLTAKVMSRAWNKTLVLDLYDTSNGRNVMLRNCLLEAGLIETEVNTKAKPWDIADAAALNPKISQLLPG